jgi:hypothetical protein
MEVNLHAVLTSELDGGFWFYSWKIRIFRIWGDAVEESCPCA